MLSQPFKSHILLVKCFHGGEQQNISYSAAVSEKHNKSVDTEADAACGRHTDLQRTEEILINAVCFLVAQTLPHRLLPVQLPAP